jgi:hypothetical protein
MITGNTGLLAQIDPTVRTPTGLAQRARAKNPATKRLSNRFHRVVLTSCDIPAHPGPDKSGTETHQV